MTRTPPSRGDWWPAARLKALRRYAFIGDSNCYGAGVLPHETLPAIAERRFNELLPAWPVEAVNFGVSGYNLWNSWLGFKQAPQVYDGLVLILCTNDADLFGHSYRARYREPDLERWEGDSPFGKAVIRCFDDMAAVSTSSALPMVVCYSNAYNSAKQLAIARILRDLCAARGLPFIDTFAHYQDRHFALKDLLVSKADSHPSAVAHAATGNHLAATVARQGWFGEFDAGAITGVPGRVLEAAQAMMDIDHYSPDVALDWALRTLEVKCHIARRAQAVAEDDRAVCGDFDVHAVQAKRKLTASNVRWHAIHRSRAFIEGIAAGHDGITTAQLWAGDALLRLNELCFALELGEEQLVTALSNCSPSPDAVDGNGSPGRFLEFIGRCKAELPQMHESLARLHGIAAPTEIWPESNADSPETSLATITQLVGSAESDCSMFESMYFRIDEVFAAARLTLPDSIIEVVTNLINTEFRRVENALEFLLRWRAVLDRIGEVGHARFTTIQLKINVAELKTTKCIIRTRVQYGLPYRLPLSNQAVFFPDESTIATLCVPLFYAGTLTFYCCTDAAPAAAIEVEFIKVEVYNVPEARIEVAPSTIFRNSKGQYVCPAIYLT